MFLHRLDSIRFGLICILRYVFCIDWVRFAFYDIFLHKLGSICILQYVLLYILGSFLCDLHFFCIFFAFYTTFCNSTICFAVYIGFIPM